MRKALLKLRLDEMHVESFTMDRRGVQAPRNVDQLPEMDSCGDWCQDPWGGENR